MFTVTTALPLLLCPDVLVEADILLLRWDLVSSAESMKLTLQWLYNPLLTNTDAGCTGQEGQACLPRPGLPAQANERLCGVAQAGPGHLLQARRSAGKGTEEAGRGSRGPFKTARGGRAGQGQCDHAGQQNPTFPQGEVDGSVDEG